MKRLNHKKLNAYFMNLSNSEEMRRIVQDAVSDFMNAETKNPLCVALLTDLGLLIEE